MHDIREQVPQLIQRKYVKMKTSPTMDVFLDGLRDVLDEAECNEVTEDAYAFFIQGLQQHENQLNINFKKVCAWISSMFSSLSKGDTESAKSVRQIVDQRKESISLNLVHLESRIELLRHCTIVYARYGDFSLFEKWGNCTVETKLLMLDRDPLATIQAPYLILPSSKEGAILRSALGHGFIDAEVLQEDARRLYSVRYGSIEKIFPDWIDDILTRGNASLLSFKSSLSNPVSSLKYLQYHANWREWLAEDMIDAKADCEISVNANQNTMLSHIYFNYLTSPEHSERNDGDPNKTSIEYHQFILKKQRYQEYVLSLRNTPKNIDSVQKGFPNNYIIQTPIVDQTVEDIRRDLISAVDRFLILLLEESPSNEESNPQRAIKYAYSEVKRMLQMKIPEERNSYTYSDVTEKILQEARLANLTFVLLEHHCKEACKLFAKKYEWKPKRRPSLSKKVRTTKAKS